VAVFSGRVGWEATAGGDVVGVASVCFGFAFFVSFLGLDVVAGGPNDVKIV